MPRSALLARITGVFVGARTRSLTADDCMIVTVGSRKGRLCRHVTDHRLLRASDSHLIQRILAEDARSKRARGVSAHFVEMRLAEQR